MFYDEKIKGNLQFLGPNRSITCLIDQQLSFCSVRIEQPLKLERFFHENFISDIYIIFSISTMKAQRFENKNVFRASLVLS